MEHPVTGLNREQAARPLEDVTEFVDTSRTITQRQLVGLHIMQNMWPEKYEAMSAELLQQMEQNASLLNEVLQQISQAPGILKVRAPNSDVLGLITGVGLDTATGEYHLMVRTSDSPYVPPAPWPLLFGEQLVLE